MKKNFVIILILVMFFSFLTLSFSARKTKKLSEKELIKRLPEKYKDWLDLVYYIITPQEKKVFLQLTNNKDRDAFIKLFWKMRDPTPGTPENEFKEEHIRRFKYANKRFKTGRPGWMTDMGKIYIILGPPNTKEYYDNVFGLYPVIVWGYYGKREWGLPAFFYVVFYKRNGIGEYVLYDPAFDGPYSLLRDIEGLDVYNPMEVYRRLKEIAPTIVKPAFSLIPGEESFVHMPSPRNSQLLMKIEELPKKRVKVSYAEHFLKYKGVVEVDYSMGYIESSFTSNIVYDEITDLYFIHFAIKPKRISLAYSETKNKYYFAFKLNVSLKRGEKIVYQTTKNYSFYFSEDEVVNKLRPLGLSIEYMFPAVEGKYKLTVLVQNSVKKEFSFVEKEVQIPSKDSVYLLKPFVTYKIKDVNPDIYLKPFKFKNFVAHIEPSSEFSMSDDKIVVSGVCGEFRNGNNYKLKLEVKSKPGYTPFEKEFEKEIPVVESKRKCEFYRFRLPELSSASYKIIARVYKNDIPLDTKIAEFNVSPLNVVPHPMEASKVVDSKNRGVFYFIIADEYNSLRMYERSIMYYEKALNGGVVIPEGVINYSKTLIMLGKYDDAIEKVQKIKDNPKYEFEYYSTVGEAYLFKGDYDNALRNLVKANEIYDSDYRVINLLGMTFYYKKMYKDALKAFNASIKLNPDQDEVKNWIRKIEELIKELEEKKSKQK